MDKKFCKNPIANVNTSYILLTGSFNFAARSKNYGANANELHILSVVDLVSNISTGMDTFITDFPVKKLIPILFKRNFKTFF